MSTLITQTAVTKNVGLLASSLKCYKTVATGLVATKEKCRFDCFIVHLIEINLYSFKKEKQCLSVTVKTDT